MKIKLLLGALLLTFLQAVSQTTAIPDTNFEQALIDLGIDSDGTVNGQILTNDASGKTILNLENKGITNLTGIEAFSNLEKLWCNDNNISIIDVSNNSLLTDLELNNNQLSNLNISSNTNLELLRCRNNQLTSLNTSNNTELMEIDCAQNQITNLDISSNNSLIQLICFSNELTDINVTNNTNLETLSCGDNSIASLDVSNNLLLKYLLFEKSNILTVDVSNNIELITLSCFENQLTNIDVSNNLLLESLSISDNLLTNIDISSNNNLESFYCGKNQIANLDLSNNTNLEYLVCDNNNLTKLNLSSLNSLVVAVCNNNQLVNLNLKNGNNASFNYFNAKDNPNLTCIQVDNEVYATTNWTNIDPQTSFSENCSIIWTSNAEDNNDFAKIDSDTDTFNWEVDNAASRGSGVRFFSKSWDSGAGNLTPDNLLITPTGEISIPVTATSISFKLNVEASNALRPAENFAIYVFDEAVGQSFDTKIYEETLTVGGDGTDKDISATIPSSFAGKNIGIIVRHYDCTGQDKLYVDNFEVSYEEFALSNKKTITQKVSIYPNPTKHSINVSLKEKSNYTLININGKAIKTGTLTPQQNNIDISKAANGLYFLTLETKNNSITKKIIKQ
jgi:Leucine-rich repeat (LRR) protein